MLSTNSALPTQSPLAESNQRTRDDASQQKSFTAIGKGQCGTIYALKGTNMAVKLPNSVKQEDELFSDAQIHKTVYEAFTTIFPPPNISIPKFEMWLSPQSTHFWTATKPRLFDQDAIKTPNYGLVSSRIYPLPHPVLEAVVETLCPNPIKQLKPEYLPKPKNKDCVLRLYLGRRHDTRTSAPRRDQAAQLPSTGERNGKDWI
jgi:hypothetical protein